MYFCNSVWLIDDDDFSNYSAENTLKINHFCDNITFFTSGKKAVAELDSLITSGEFPDFIFLDLNMPVLDGWEFLNLYRKFPEEVKKKCTIYILSSSINEEDIQRSKLYEDVRDFFSKPLLSLNLETIKFQTENSRN